MNTFPDFLPEATSLKEELVRWRRHFHQNPEPSGQEFGTAKAIASHLTSLGYTVQTDVGAPMPGVTAVISGTNVAPGASTVAVRADMDALRQTEVPVTPYRSQVEGMMHGCGHDAHMAIQLGVAQLIANHRAQLPGTVKLLFQPSEEVNGGAVPMIRDHALESPDVDAIFALHVDPSYSVGEVGISYGQTRASSDRLIIHILGKSGHGAYPHNGIDAIVLASHVLVALQSLMSREKDIFSPGVLSFGVIEGGKQPNSICDDVTLRGILRVLTPDVREELLIRIEQIVAAVTTAFGGSYTFERIKSYDAMINDNAMVDLQKEIIGGMLGEDKVKVLPHAKMGVEDFGYFLQKVPGAMCFLGIANQEKNICAPLHSTSFDLDEDALVIGAALQTATIWRYLETHKKS